MLLALDLTGERLAAMLVVLEANTSIDPAWLTNAGALGLFAVAWVKGWIHSDRAMRDKDNEITYLRGELGKVNNILEGIREQLMGQTIPNINQTAHMFERGSDGLMAMVNDIHDRLVTMNKEAGGAHDGKSV